MKIVFRVLFYALGQFILAFGVAFSVNSGLGVSPVNSFPFAISRIAGGGDAIPYLGTCVNIVFCCYVLLQILLLRRAFKLKNLLQVVFSTLFGFFVDTAKALLGSFTFADLLPIPYLGSLLMLGCSILFIGLGLSLYLSADIVPMPMEGLGLAITDKLGGKYKYHNVKIVLDCASVAMGVAISLIAFGNIEGIREGTVITALLAGKALGLFQKWLRPRIRTLCFGPEATPTAG